jgi:hypothetical protein
MMRPTAILVALVALAGPAAAQPNSCRDLKAAPYAALGEQAKDKIGGAEFFQTAKPFKKLVISISMARAPHIARAILLECPGVEAIDQGEADDDRHFQSTIRLHLTSFAALTRIAQIPAISYISIFDPTAPRKPPPPHRIPEPFIE